MSGPRPFALAMALAICAFPATAEFTRSVPFVNPFLRSAPPTTFVSDAGIPVCSTGQCDPLTTLHINYFGGKVIPNVKVYAVFWTSGVDATTQSGIGPFYQAITNSGYVDWLTEYSTVPFGVNGSNQSIGRGTYAGSITITPITAYTNTCPYYASPGATTCTTDAALQAELQAQINAGSLPFPDQHTIYMLHFPPHFFIDKGGGSCIGGGFCAYHGTHTLAGFGSVYYGVFPDFGSGSGCDVGCGAGSTFQNMCSAASHELGEAITDAEVGLATVYGPPLGWYDNAMSSQGEIGDMCNQITDTITSGLGTAFTVQTLLSKKTWDAGNSALTPACVATRLEATDFKIYFDP